MKVRWNIYIYIYIYVCMYVCIYWQRRGKIYNYLPWKDREHQSVQNPSKACHSKYLCPRLKQPFENAPKPGLHFQWYLKGPVEKAGIWQAQSSWAEETWTEWSQLEWTSPRHKFWQVAETRACWAWLFGTTHAWPFCLVGWGDCPNLDFWTQISFCPQPMDKLMAGSQDDLLHLL